MLGFGGICEDTNPTGWTPEDIAALPEASLVPPDAKASRKNLEDGKDRVTVDTETNVSFSIGFDGPYQAVMNFYDVQLTAAGWSVAPSVGQSTRERDAKAWHKNGLRYRVGIPRHLDTTPSGELLGYKYSASITISAFGKKPEK